MDLKRQKNVDAAQNGSDLNSRKFEGEKKEKEN